ncbi:nucleolar protein 12-like [Mangifera indica]|uniref:nucleolar protein 12-like n=1 Tax=Mangifera indica TaxID=29780 RepID=UPI001CFAFFD6|nr:nucleolar protein 12-like [Mangifera indica]
MHQRSQKVRGRHMKKRALKNKALSVSFDEKGLKDYVTGFRKRKKKRRQVAEKKQEEANRLKRHQERKKRRLEKEACFVWWKSTSHQFCA